MSVRAVVVLAGFLTLAGAVPKVADAGVKKGDRAAKFVSVTDASGKKVSLKSFKGKVVVLTFGASWCKPCKKELPAYESLAKKWADQNVVFVAVNIDTDIAKGKEFVKAAGLKHVQAFYDPKGSTVSSFDPPTMPTTYVINKGGVVKHVHAGYRAGDEKEIAKTLKAEVK